MKKGSKFVVSLLLLLVFSVFFINFVSAESVLEKITNSVNSIFSSDASSSTMLNIGWVLLMVLLVLIIYSISSFLPFVSDNEFIKWGISIIVSILSFIYVDKATVAGILITYQALGIALTSVVPIIVLIVFNWRLRESGKPGMVFITYLTNIFVILFIAFNWLTLDTSSDFTWLYPATLILAIIWFFLEKHVMNWVSKKTTLSRIESTEDLKKAELTGQLAKLIAERESLLEGTFAEDSPQVKAIDEQIKKLKEVIARS